MWPAVPVRACATISPWASNTAAERSPTSRTMGVNEVRIRAAACSLATATSRLQRISSVTGSSAAGLRLATADLQKNVAVSVSPRAAARTHDQRRLPLLDDGGPSHLLLWPQPVAVVDGGLHEATVPGVPDPPPSLRCRAGCRRGGRVKPGFGARHTQSPGHHRHLDPGRSPPVERDVGALERFFDQTRGRAAQTRAQADRDGVALSAVAGVDLDLGPCVVRRHASAVKARETLTPHPVQ